MTPMTGSLFFFPLPGLGVYQGEVIKEDSRGRGRVKIMDMISPLKRSADVSFNTKDDQL